MTALVLLLLAAAPASPLVNQTPKLAVLDLTAGAGIDASTAGPMTEAITGEAQRRGFFEVISQRDISTMLGLERQKQLLGCSEDSNSCLTELSGALGTRFVLSGTLARLGDAYQLTLNTLDTQKAQPLGRATRLAKDLGTLQAQIPWAVAEATATPAPPAPSRALPYTLIGVGGAAVVVGLVLGVMAFNTQGQLEGELNTGATRAGVLKPQQYYLEAFGAVDRNKYIAVGLLVGGAAAAIIGLLIMPKDVGAQVALVPTHQGFAFAGVF